MQIKTLNFSPSRWAFKNTTNHYIGVLKQGFVGM